MKRGGIFKGFADIAARRLRQYRAMERSDKALWWGNFLVRNAIYIIISLLVVYVQIFSLVTEGSQNAFLSFGSIIDIVKRSGANLFLALGVGGIIVMTGTDLSAGRIMGLTACVCASLLQLPLEKYSAKMFPGLTASPAWLFIALTILLSMSVGAAVGVFNGFCVAKFKLHPFIVTLSTQLMLYGTVLMYVRLGNNGGGPISGLIDEYKDVVKYTLDIGGTAIPLYVFYAVAAAAAMWFVWNKTALGKSMYAVGANAEAANVSGISIMRTTVLIFMIAGILYGFSGFIEAARTGSNSATTGVNAELDAIAACVIGGVSFTGGVGKISGIITGVILLQIISVALQWLGVPSDMQYITKGAIILVACAIDMRKYLSLR